jgi:hypothetical protein
MRSGMGGKPEAWGQAGGEAPALRWRQRRGDARRCPLPRHVLILWGVGGTVEAMLDHIPNLEMELRLHLIPERFSALLELVICRSDVD